MVGIGVIGTGFGRQVHIPGFMSVEGARVVGVSSGTYEKARETAESYRLAQAFKSWRELIECPEIQGVSIATPPHMHEEIALAAIRAGKAVFCEKPMAMNAQQAVNMLRAAERAGIVHMIDFEFREIPAFRLARQIISQGRLGRIQHVNVRWIVASWANRDRLWTWRAEKRRGGGALGALGVHVFDYLEWMLGPICSIFAHLSTRIAERRDTAGFKRAIETEDCCQLVVELSYGIPVNISISSIASLDRGHHIEIYGEKRTLIIRSRSTDYGKGFSVLEGNHRKTGEPVEVKIPEDLEFEVDHADGRLKPFIKLAEKFVGAMNRKDPGEYPNFLDGVKARLWMDLAYRSNLERRLIMNSSEKLI